MSTAAGPRAGGDGLDDIAKEGGDVLGRLTAPAQEAFRKEINTLITSFRRLSVQVNELSPERSAALDAQRVYVPVLRGLRPLSSDVDVYTERTQRDYFPEGESSQKQTAQHEQI